jgi:hypothetical protein
MRTEPDPGGSGSVAASWCDPGALGAGPWGADRPGTRIAAQLPAASPQTVSTMTAVTW